MLTCHLHGWQFDLASGRCLTAEDRHLRVRPALVTSGVIIRPGSAVPDILVALRRKNTVERTGVELLRAWAAASGGAPPGVSARLRDVAEDLAVAADRATGRPPGRRAPLRVAGRCRRVAAGRDRPLGGGPGSTAAGRRRRASADLRLRHGAFGRLGRRLPPRRRSGRLHRPDHRAGAAQRPPTPPAAGVRPLRVAQRPARPRLRPRRGRRLPGRSTHRSSATPPAWRWPPRPGSSSPPARRSPSMATGCWCWPAAPPSWTDRVAILGAALHTHAPAAPRPDRRPGSSGSRPTPPTCAPFSST